MKMRLLEIILLLLLACNHLKSEIITYEGYIDTYPIDLVIDFKLDGNIEAFYVYDKYDESINLVGYTSADSLVMFELDSSLDTTAIFQFSDFDSNTDLLIGRWTNTGKRTLKVSLEKVYKFEGYDDSSFEEIEFIQRETTDNHYFKLLLTKEERKSIEVVGVRIYEKRTDKLVQEMEFYGDFFSLNNLYVNDFNFDGILDFSILQDIYGSGNTWSIYFLYDTIINKFIQSEIEGTSLEFDNENQLVYGHNQSLTEYTSTTYKVVNNKLELVDIKCFKSGEDGFEEVECE
ncbi:MAG: XAC2610-related protein [Chlorobiota bacterium]